MSYDHLFKIILIGDSGVGKTSFGERFSTGKFDSDQALTIGIDYHTQIVMRGKERIKIQIWDTAGQEQFHSLISAYFQGVAGVVLMFDVSQIKSFQQVSRWLKRYREGSNESYITPILLIGSKIDAQRAVASATARQYAYQNGLLYEEISSKRNENVTAAMMKLVDAIYSVYIVNMHTSRGVSSVRHDAITLNASADSTPRRNAFLDCCIVS